MSRCRAGIWSQFLHRVGFTCTRCHQNVCGLLPRISTLTTCVAVYFCCTFLKVAFTGRYPALLLCGARTFLVRKFPRNRLAVFYVTYCITNWKNCQSKTAVRCFLWQNKAIFHLCKVFFAYHNCHLACLHPHFANQMAYILPNCHDICLYQLPNDIFFSIIYLYNYVRKHLRKGK